MIKIIFWFSFVLIVYTYLGYPIIIIILATVKNKPIGKKEIYPKVTVVIAAYNEKKAIERKLDNTLNFDYPKEKLEIIVASDGSTDNTVSILKKYIDKRVKLINFKKRLGKTKIQNEAVKISSGEILFFSDVTSIHPSNVIKMIIQNFADETVGCVTGNVVFTAKRENLISEGAALRLKYESFLRKKQAEFHSLFGATGCIYAIRKDLYEPLREDLVSDFIEPLKILEKGYRTVYEPKALALISRKIDLIKEFARRTRVIQQGLYGLFFMKHLLNPFRFGFLSFSLISHRLFRWLMPMILIILIFSNIFLIDKMFYIIFIVTQFVFYLCGAIGLMVNEQKSFLKFLYPITYFCMINLAAIVGFYRLLRGKKEIFWETIR